MPIFAGTTSLFHMNLSPAMTKNKNWNRNEIQYICNWHRNWWFFCQQKCKQKSVHFPTIVYSNEMKSKRVVSVYVAIVLSFISVAVGSEITRFGFQNILHWIMFRFLSFVTRHYLYLNRFFFLSFTILTWYIHAIKSTLTL